MYTQNIYIKTRAAQYGVKEGRLKKHPATYHSHSMFSVVENCGKELVSEACHLVFHLSSFTSNVT